MCSVCGSGAFRGVTWRTATGSQWPALECMDCGAITRDMQLQTRSVRSSTIMPPASPDEGALIPRVPAIPHEAGARDVAALLGYFE
jgi:hypothetical protein